MKKFNLTGSQLDDVKRLLEHYPDLVEIDHDDGLENPNSYRIKYMEVGSDWTAHVWIKKDGTVGWRWKQEYPPGWENGREAVEAARKSHRRELGT